MTCLKLSFKKKPCKVLLIYLNFIDTGTLMLPGELCRQSLTNLHKILHDLYMKLLHAVLRLKCSLLLSLAALQQICRTAAETKEQVMYNTQLLQDIARRRHDTNKERIGRLPSSCRLPMTTYSEVLAVEQQLKSKEFYCQFVSNLPTLRMTNHVGLFFTNV